MADHNKPTVSSNYATEFLQQLHDKINDVAKWFAPTDASPSNQPVGAKRINGTTVERWTGTVWTAIARLLSTDNATALSSLGVTDYARTLLDDGDAATALSTLGVTDYARTLLDDGDAATARATLGALSPNDFSVSHAQTGYSLLPNGFIMQWGRSTATDISFPRLFTTECYSVTVTCIDANQSTVNLAANPTLNGFSVKKYLGATQLNTLAISWMAFGK
jgi:hypothetical protein